MCGLGALRAGSWLLPWSLHREGLLAGAPGASKAFPCKAGRRPCCRARGRNERISKMLSCRGTAVGLARSTGPWARPWLRALPRQAAGHQLPPCAGTLLCPCLSCQHGQMGHGEALQGPRLQGDGSWSQSSAEVLPAREEELDAGVAAWHQQHLCLCHLLPHCWQLCQNWDADPTQVWWDWVKAGENLSALNHSVNVLCCRWEFSQSQAGFPLASASPLSPGDLEHLPG